MFAFRSVSSIVIFAANTGKVNTSKVTVIKIDHTNNGRCSNIIPPRIFIIVAMKLIPPRIDDTPAKCNEKIAKSTEGPAWLIFLAKGG